MDPNPVFGPKREICLDQLGVPHGEEDVKYIFFNKKKKKFLFHMAPPY